jgi:chromosome segregation ATPase
VPCHDVITWKSRGVQNPSEKPEDLILLDRADERARAAEKGLADANVERDRLVTELTQLQAHLTEAETERLNLENEGIKIRNDLNLRESELRQRQEEIEQTRIEVAKKQEALDARTAELSANQQRIKDHELQCAAMERGYQQSLAKVEAETRLADAKLLECRQELATLTQLLHHQEQRTAAVQENFEWLLSVHQKVRERPKWWNLMPESWRQRREHEWLQRAGLFDAEAYLQRYPDVAAEGFDPLEHFLRHGLQEGRVPALPE